MLVVVLCLKGDADTFHLVKLFLENIRKRRPQILRVEHLLIGQRCTDRRRNPCGGVHLETTGQGRIGGKGAVRIIIIAGHQKVTIGQPTEFIILIEARVDGVTKVREAGRHKGQTGFLRKDAQFRNHRFRQAHVIRIIIGFRCDQHVGLGEGQSRRQGVGRCVLVVRLRLQRVEDETGFGTGKLQDHLYVVFVWESKRSFQ